MAPTGGTVVLDPQAKLVPRGINWTKFLAQIAEDETIVQSSYAYTGPDTALIVSAPSIVVGSRKTQARFTPGTEGASYLIVNHILTSSGVEDERSFTLFVKQR